MTTKKELIETMTEQLVAIAEEGFKVNGRDYEKAKKDEYYRSQFSATKESFIELVSRLYPNSKPATFHGYWATLYRVEQRLEEQTRAELERAEREAKEVAEFKKSLEAYALFK